MASFAMGKRLIYFIFKIFFLNDHIYGTLIERSPTRTIQFIWFGIFALEYSRDQ